MFEDGLTKKLLNDFFLGRISLQIGFDLGLIRLISVRVFEADYAILSPPPALPTDLSFLSELASL